jgi:hypothetical protein
MKQLIVLTIAAIFILSCTNNKKEPAGKKDTKMSLRTDTINVVKLTDTLVIYESTCRGCAYEQSTHFDISDSLGIIKLEDIITTDSNPSGMDGGSISKDLILVPLKTGTTIFKLYKFWEQVATAKDSARFTSYTIEVRN